MTASKPLYLAGPMTGIQSFNFPAFDRAVASLRAAGFAIISPHERDSLAVQAAARASPDGCLASLETATHETWGDMLARDVKIVVDESSGVVLLSGWERSRGARLEAYVAALCSLPLYQYGDAGLIPLDSVAVRARLLP